MTADYDADKMKNLRIVIDIIGKLNIPIPSGSADTLMDPGAEQESNLTYHRKAHCTMI
jgi:hypothetical protein